MFARQMRGHSGADGVRRLRLLLLRAAAIDSTPVSTLKCLPYLYRNGPSHARDNEAVTEVIKSIASKNILHISSEHFPSFRRLAAGAPSHGDGAVRCTSYILAMRHGMYAARRGVDPSEIGVSAASADPSVGTSDPHRLAGTSMHELTINPLLRSDENLAPKRILVIWLELAKSFSQAMTPVWPAQQVCLAMRVFLSAVLPPDAEKDFERGMKSDPREIAGNLQTLCRVALWYVDGRCALRQATPIDRRITQGAVPTKLTRNEGAGCPLVFQLHTLRRQVEAPYRDHNIHHQDKNNNTNSNNTTNSSDEAIPMSTEESIGAEEGKSSNNNNHNNMNKTTTTPEFTANDMVMRSYKEIPHLIDIVSRVLASLRQYDVGMRLHAQEEKEVGQALMTKLAELVVIHAESWTVSEALQICRAASACHFAWYPMLEALLPHLCRINFDGPDPDLDVSAILKAQGQNRLGAVPKSLPPLVPHMEEGKNIQCVLGFASRSCAAAALPIPPELDETLAEAVLFIGGLDDQISQMENNQPRVSSHYIRQTMPLSRVVDCGRFLYGCHCGLYPGNSELLHGEDWQSGLDGPGYCRDSDIFDVDEKKKMATTNNEGSKAIPLTYFKASYMKEQRSGSGSGGAPLIKSCSPKLSAALLRHTQTLIGDVVGRNRYIGSLKQPKKFASLCRLLYLATLPPNEAPAGVPEDIAKALFHILNRRLHDQVDFYKRQIEAEEFGPDLSRSRILVDITRREMKEFNLPWRTLIKLPVSLRGEYQTRLVETAVDFVLDEKLHPLHLAFFLEINTPLVSVEAWSHVERFVEALGDKICDKNFVHVRHLVHIIISIGRCAPRIPKIRGKGDKTRQTFIKFLYRSTERLLTIQKGVEYRVPTFMLAARRIAYLYDDGTKSLPLDLMSNIPSTLPERFQGPDVKVSITEALCLPIMALTLRIRYWHLEEELTQQRVAESFQRFEGEAEGGIIDELWDIQNTYGLGKATPAMERWRFPPYYHQQQQQQEHGDERQSQQQAGSNHQQEENPQDQEQSAENDEPESSAATKNVSTHGADSSSQRRQSTFANKQSQSSDADDMIM